MYILFIKTYNIYIPSKNIETTMTTILSENVKTITKNKSNKKQIRDIDNKIYKIFTTPISSINESRYHC